jgi:predicted acyltransferase
LTPEGNLALYIDRFILNPAHMYDATRLDPEGLFATLPSFVTVVIGYCAGYFMRTRPKTVMVSLLLAAAGITSLAAGHLWGLLLPVCKDLWTGSFVLVSSGWSLLCMALCYELIDVRGLHAPGLPFRVMGMNALALFIGSGLLSRALLHIRTGTAHEAPSLWSAAHGTLCASWLTASNASSLLFSLAYLLFWWLILYALYRRGIFIKI